MAKKPDKILNLDGKTCRMGKISNNLEHHGEEWVIAFTIPITGVMLTKEELNAFMRDRYTHASWFASEKGVAQPMAWWSDEDFQLSQSYKAHSLTIVVSGDKDLEFEGEEPSSEDADDGRAACEIAKISLCPQVGGMTELRFSLSLRPGVGRTNLLLQEHQHREIKLTCMGATAKEKDTKQQQLPMGEPAANGNATPPGPP